MKNPYQVIFLNPRAAQVFQDLARDVAARYSPSLIWTESSEIVQFPSDDHLVVRPVPKWACYNRRNLFTRACSMVGYFVYVFTKVLFSSRRSLLFLVTTPPHLGFIGWFFKKIRRQPYVMLVYDIHPDALIGAGMLKDGWAARLWRRFNRVILNSADAVITIGEYMAARLEGHFDVTRTPFGQTAVIHNWSDVDRIKPLAREDNPFIRQYKLQDKFIVMYSGNMGATHDMETLVEAARQLKDTPGIRFVMIGEGAKKQYVVDSKEKYGLDNMLILSYLPQDQLPYSIPSADIAIAAVANGIEGCLVPCKFYSYLAAGSAVVAICNDNCEIADIVRTEQCGRVVALGDRAALVEAILNYYRNPEELTKARANSRRAAVQKYSRQNTQQYIDVIEKVYPSKRSQRGAR